MQETQTLLTLQLDKSLQKIKPLWELFFVISVNLIIVYFVHICKEHVKKEISMAELVNVLLSSGFEVSAVHILA